jgi:hypothetical protein
MKQAALLQLFAYVVFVYARFVAFPRTVLAFRAELKEKKDPNMVHLLNFSALALGLFNTAIVIPVSLKTARYVIKAFFNTSLNLNDAA